MYAERHTVNVTTNGSGAATEYSANVTGRILAIHYEKTDFADGVDFDITLEGTAEELWDEDDVNAAKIVYPRVGVHDTTGTAATLDGTRLMREPIVAVNDRIKVVIANGGDTKNGTIHIIVG